MSGRESEHVRSDLQGGPAVGPPPGEGEAEEFGVWLRRQREGREIDLREIAETSKISIRYLQALESGRFDLLPAEVFAKGFLRQYARYVGLDPEEVVNAFLAAQRDPAEDLEGDESKSARARPLGFGWFLLVVVLVLALVAFVAWLGRERGRAESADVPASARIGQPAREAAPPAREAAAHPSGAGEATERAADVAEPGADASGPEAGDGSASEGAGSAATAPPEVEPSERAAADGEVRVVVDFLGSCWVEATVDGERRVAETRVQGESLDLVGDEIVLRVGDAGAVEIEVDGEPWPVEDGAGQVRTWTFRDDGGEGGDT